MYPDVTYSDHVLSTFQFFQSPTITHSVNIGQLFCIVLLCSVPHLHSIVINHGSCLFMHCQSLSIVVMRCHAISHIQSPIQNHSNIFRPFNHLFVPICTCSLLFVRWFAKILIVLCIFAQLIVADASFVSFRWFL